MKKRIKRKKTKVKKENSNNLIKIILILIIILSIIFFIILIMQSSVLDSVNSLYKKPNLITVKDECSLIFNNIVHQIKNEGDCKIRCRNECNLENMNFYDINFTLNSNSCNLCNCYCK